MKKKHLSWLLSLGGVTLALLSACTAPTPPATDTPSSKPTAITQPLTESAPSETETESVSELPALPYTLTLNSSDPTVGTTEGAGTFLSGNAVTVRATPRLLGYEFEGWFFGDQRLSTDPTYTFTMPDGNLTLRASFRVRRDLSDFTFTSTEHSCIITGVTDQNKVELIVPDYATGLSEGAFRNLTALRAIALPEGITELPEDLFRGCSALTDLTYSSRLSAIGMNAFSGCDSLRCSTYGNGRYLAGETPFAWLIGVEDPTQSLCIVHPDTKYLAEGAFMEHDTLTSITFTEDGALREIGRYAFFGCSALERVTLPEGITTVAEGAFAECAALEAITLPRSLRSIEKNAFKHCDSLEEIRYLGSMTEWEELSIEETNRLFELTPIHCSDGDSIYPIRFYGRSLLTGADAYLYDLFETAIMAEEPTESLSIDPEYTVNDDQCVKVFEIFLHDYPECFWTGDTLSFSLNADTGAVLSIQIHYTFTGEALTEAKASLSAVVEEILGALPEGTPFEQTLYLHDEVAKRVTYLSGDHDQTAYGALVGGKAVCAGYSGAYQLLLQSAGYKAWSVSGDAGEPHRWNVVWLDHSTCVYTDVTWDDAEDRPISHGYFNLSLSEMSEDHLPYDPSHLPACEHDLYSYEDLSTVPTVSDGDGIDDLLPLLTDTEDGSVTLVFYYLGADLGSWLNRALPELRSALGWQSLSASYHPVRKEVILSLSRGA